MMKNQNFSRSNGIAQSSARPQARSLISQELELGIETNLRVASPRMGLTLPARNAILKGSRVTPEIAEKVCQRVRNMRELTAVVSSKKENHLRLMVATNQPIQSHQVTDDDWEATISDGGEQLLLSLASESDRGMIAQLLERALTRTIGARTRRWSVDSFRHWYDPAPLAEENGITAYRRISVSTVFVAEIGIGIAADVQTAYFTEKSLAWFFDSRQSANERERREQWAKQLMNRQDGQKGTLLYDCGRRGFSKCYFEKAPMGLTCGSTGTIRVAGKSYDSLWHYYRERSPEMEITKETPAVSVSFKGIPKPVFIAANRLRIRVMNDSLPESLRDLDKISPEERRGYVENFWSALGPRPFGNLGVDLEEDFWRPGRERVWQAPLPILEFGEKYALLPPSAPGQGTAPSRRSALKAHYWARKDALERHGAYHLPSMVSRQILCPHPVGTEEAARELADAIAEKLHLWTKKKFDMILQPYTSVPEGIELVRSFTKAGLALWVLPGGPTPYYKVRHELDTWRLKRVTEVRLTRTFRHLKQGKRSNGRFDLQRGRQSWESFVQMTALDVFCQLEGVPFRARQIGDFEAQLVIDVSHDRRYFGVSLLIARQDPKQPFGIFVDIDHKADTKHETINAEVLEDTLVDVVKRWLLRHAAPLKSLLVIRDGKLCGEEQTAVDKAIKRLIDADKITPHALVDTVELHKDTLKALRMWEILPSGTVDNVEEGTAIEIAPDFCLLACTGRASLTQGTAEPLALLSRGNCANLRSAANSLFASAQMNWGSPTVAQRLALPVKRVDQGLLDRAAQDIKRWR